MAERIIIKSDRQVELMRKAGRLTAQARAYGASLVRPGITTKELDHAMFEFITKHGGYPSFLHLYGFPGTACISVNDAIIHGIPSKRRLEEGDIVSIDVGATYKGYVGDCAGTFPVGEASPEALELIRITRQSFFEGIKFARAGNRLNDISAAVQQYAESHGCGVVRDYVGHGIGTKMHEDPEVPNYVPDRRERRPNPRLLPGMTLAVEPMINAGGPAVRVLSNKWTVVTVDGSLSAHYENTILITDGEPEILTLADDI